MQTASTTQAIIPCMRTSDKKVRWFSATGSVVYEPDAVEVHVGGTLIGSFNPKDKPARDLLLIGLAQDPHVRKGKLAKAFGLGSERLRQNRGGSVGPSIA